MSNRQEVKKAISEAWDMAFAIRLVALNIYPKTEDVSNMEQEKINYCEIMALGFTEDVQNDSVYEAEHGYKYCIITKQLTKKIYLDWEKDTKLCKMVRLSNHKTGDIGAELPIKNLEHLKEMINFFTKDK